MSTTLRDIARMCAVDVSTVSRALRKDPRVKAETRDRVKEVADRLGYRPNLAARSLVAGRSFTVWFLLHSLEDSMDRGAAQHASRYLTARDYDLVVAVHHREEKTYRRLISRLTQGLADGALIIPRGEMADPIIRPLALSGYPLVFLDIHVEGLPVPVVTTDNAAASAELVRRCAAESVPEIAVLFNDSNPVERERLRGALDALREQGIDHRVLTDRDEWTPTRTNGPLGIVGTNQKTIHAFAHRNAATWQDRRLVCGCFDAWHGEPQPAEKVFVAIQDFEKMGQTAVDHVLDLIEGRAELAFRRITVPAKEFLVVTRTF